MIEGTPLPVWAGAKAWWTEDGTRIEIPLNGPLGPRQARSILRALTDTVGRVVGGEVRVEVHQTVKEENRMVALPRLAVVAAHLWATDPHDFREAIEAGVRQGAEQYQAEASADEEHMTEWMEKLRQQIAS